MKKEADRIDNNLSSLYGKTYSIDLNHILQNNQKSTHIGGLISQFDMSRPLLIY